MGIRAGIEHYTQALAFCDCLTGLVEPVNQFAFMVGLSKNQVESEALGKLLAGSFDIRQCLRTIGGRVTDAQQVQVWTIEYVNRFHPASLAVVCDTQLLSCVVGGSRAGRPFVGRRS